MGVEALFRELEMRAEGTPYRVERTPAGVTVAVDIANVTHAARLFRSGYKTAFSVLVEADDANRSYTREMRTQEVRYTVLGSGDLVRASFTGHFTSGTVKQFEYGGGKTRKSIGSPVEPYRYSFNSREITELVDGVFAEAGWTRRRDRRTKIGIGFAIGGGIFAVLAGIFGIVMAVIFG